MYKKMLKLFKFSSKIKLKVGKLNDWQTIAKEGEIYDQPELSRIVQIKQKKEAR